MNLPKRYEILINEKGKEEARKQLLEEGLENLYIDNIFKLYDENIDFKNKLREVYKSVYDKANIDTEWLTLLFILII